MYDNINMPIDGIEWDSKKAQINLEKHGVSFETAQYVFSDPERLWRLDRSEGNMSGEERWQTIGQVGKVLFVVHTECGEKNHIISARLADKNDRRSYNGYYQIDDKGWTKAL
jgi:uncharacterized DUF497 family protein